MQTPAQPLPTRRTDLVAHRDLSRQDTLTSLPTVQAAGLCGGVKYWAGQFNDANLALALTGLDPDLQGFLKLAAQYRLD
jgi:glycerol-3-phosphate dehydrogenase